MNRRIPMVVLPAAAVIAVLTFALDRRNGDDAVLSGTIEATEADLGFMLPGRVDSVFVREGDRVVAGQVLAVLDRLELDARLRAARSQESAARAVLGELEAGSRPEELEQARAALRAAEERLSEATRNLERAERLRAGGAISAQEHDRVRTLVEVATAERDRARESLRLAELGPRAERIAAQRAAVAQAAAAVGQVEAQLAHAVITAPAGGIVTRRHREPGEAVGAGNPVLTLMNPDDRWVRIYVREDRVGAVSLGQPASIAIDTWPDSSWSGEVAYISEEAEFTPRNVQTTEERVRLVYAVKVRILGDTVLALKPGIPADVVLGGVTNP